MKDKKIDKSVSKTLAELPKTKTHVSRDTNREFDATLTLGQRLADKVAAFGGASPENSFYFRRKIQTGSWNLHF